ncbi:MAG TPA: penicillin-binding protein 2, partial [Rhodobacteraceae bacterium]|nr:penicillin-binding protein 2 [Paracoccaceae bacterium]
MRRSPRDSAESQRTITRRAMFLGASQLAFVGVLGARMQYLQVDQADQFRLLADENRINIRLLPPARGLIYDRNGKPLAINKQVYRITIVREDAGDVDQVVNRLRALVPLDPDELEKALEELKKRSPFVPVTIADRLSWQDIAKVGVNAPALPGITPEVGLTRHYPLAEDFAHIVGYVGAVNEADLQRLDDRDPLLQIPRFQIGKVGVEAKMERKLRGKAGIKRIEVNAVGRVMRELGREEGEPGANLQLTVDADLQNYVQARLEGESAAAVVIDTATGDLLAIGSTPAFDPNKFVGGISQADYSALLNDKYRPLPNKAVQGVYPPASTFKIISALAALEAGVVTPEETVKCKGFIEVGGRRFHCWKRAGHGNVNLHNSLKKSCDVY